MSARHQRVLHVVRCSYQKPVGFVILGGTFATECTRCHKQVAGLKITSLTHTDQVFDRCRFLEVVTLKRRGSPYPAISDRSRGVAARLRRDSRTGTVIPWPGRRVPGSWLPKSRLDRRAGRGPSRYSPRAAVCAPPLAKADVTRRSIRVSQPAQIARHRSRSRPAKVAVADCRNTMR